MEHKFKTIDCWVDEHRLLELLSNKQHSFNLHSDFGNERLGRYSILGADPFLTFTSFKNEIVVNKKGKKILKENTDPFTEMKLLLENYKININTELPFIGGAVGYFGYDNYSFLEDVSNDNIDDIKIPDAFWGFYDKVYIFDHKNKTIILSVINYDGKQDLSKNITEMLEILTASTNKTEPDFFVASNFSGNMNKDYYIKAINKIKNYIRAGEVYQVNFTQRFSCDFKGSYLGFYHKLKEINPAPFSAYVDTGMGIIISSSPERYLKIRNNKIETRPIKGTISRDQNVVADLANKNKLYHSEKDRAELLMIVDLERNDLGRIAVDGTVKVDELFLVESYATVHHLVASITAEIAIDIDIIDCIKNTFPGGSITGAPKIRAMEIIEELEPTKRKAYTGALGYIGFNNVADLNIAIRTVIINNNKAYFQVGGGVVWDSEAEAEYEESLLKGKALRKALIGEC